MAVPSSDSEPGGEPPQIAAADPRPGGYPRSAPMGGFAAQVIAALVLLTGLWVATSPRFLTLQNSDTSAATEVIIGLVIAAITALALLRGRGFAGLQFTGLVLGVWAVLITSFMLDARVAMAAPWYWSNTWSGAVLAVLGLAGLSTLRPSIH